MEDHELRALWQSAPSAGKPAEDYARLSASQLHKLKSSLRPLRRTHGITIGIGVVWLSLVAFLIYHAWSAGLVFFILSAGLHFIITAAAIGVYVRHLILIRRIDLSSTVVETQESLAFLQGSTIEITRWLFLQLPLFTIFHINETMLPGHAALWLLQGVVTASFTWLGIWLFRNINLRNADKNWFRLMFKGPEWKPIIEARKFVEEIREYKEEDPG